MPGGENAHVRHARHAGRSRAVTELARPAVITLEIDIRRPRLDIQAPADKDALPLIRQAMRAVGQWVGASAQALHDTELVLTEACANAVRHAYGDGDGRIDVRIEVRATDMLAIVRDSGCGMTERPRGTDGGLGLTLIEAITEEVEIRSRRGAGTEVRMALPLDRAPAAGSSQGSDLLAQIVVRRMVAMAAAQTDMVPEHITEALLAAEIVARHASTHTIGDSIRVRLEQLPDAVEVVISRLQPAGAEAILHAAAMPVVGSVVERLADEVWTVPADGRPGEGEELALRFAA
jgi:serine/threonine-protein kinase RsbW